MAGAAAELKQVPFGATQRRDWWWVQPLAVFVGLTAFGVYSFWAILAADNYRFGPYLSPFYSPELFGTAKSWFGPKPGWWPALLPWSPAWLILWAPLGFRVTCYYYRGAYYKAFWGDPPACAVGEPRARYRGENAFPLIIQNIHRYFLYLALLFIVVLTYDVWEALWFENRATGAAEFGIGVGTLVLAINVVLLAGYTFGCHSLRHLVGGGIDSLSRHPVRCSVYNCVTRFNGRHMAWAWPSLFWVGFSDFYVRMCAMGALTDWRIF
jgi:hypothetical protein